MTKKICEGKGRGISRLKRKKERERMRENERKKEPRSCKLLAIFDLIEGWLIGVSDKV